MELWQALTALVGTIVTAYFLYRGAIKTSSAAREGVQQTAHVAAQESALQAWKAFAKPLQEEIARLGRELATERQTRIEKERADEKERVEQKRLIAEQIATLTDRVELLTVEVKHWKSMAKAIARWATVLRDEILRLEGDVPPIPDELMMIQLVEERGDEIGA